MYLIIPVVQNRITAYWFKNKELALAFGITLAFSRLGSVLNFLLTQNVEARLGLTWTLWGGKGYLSSNRKKMSLGVLTRADTNGPVHLQKTAKVYKFQIIEEEGLYYSRSKSKDADQLCRKCTADLRRMLCGIGFLSDIVVSFLDIHGVRQLGDTKTLKTVHVMVYKILNN